MTRRPRKGMVGVVPCVAEAEKGQGSEVGAAVLVAEGLLSERVAERVGAPRHVVEERHPHDATPQPGQQRAPDGPDDHPPDSGRDEEREHGPQDHGARDEGEVGVPLEIGAPTLGVDFVGDEEPAGVGVPEPTEQVAEARPLGTGEWGSPGRSVKAWWRRCCDTQLVREPSMPIVPAMARVTFSHRAGTKERWLKRRWKPRLSPIPVTMYMPTANPRSSHPMPWFQKITTATTTAINGRATTRSGTGKLDTARSGWERRRQPLRAGVGR